LITVALEVVLPFLKVEPVGCEGVDPELDLLGVDLYPDEVVFRGGRHDDMLELEGGLEGRTAAQDESEVSAEML